MSVTFSIKGERVKYEDANGLSDWENFSNLNAAEVLRILGLAFPDLMGEIVDVDSVIRRALRALNDESKDYSMPGYSEQWKDRARVIVPDITDESMRRRIRAVLNLCIQAKRRGTTVVFG